MIRKIEERDREDFLRLSAEFYASPVVLHDIPASRHEAVFDEFMRGSAYTDGVILEADGKTVGFGITAKTYSREAGGMVLWLEELYILPEYRSRGLGREFFAYAEGYARENGYARIRLEVEEDNVRAVSLYERLGYLPLEYKQMLKEKF